MKLKEELKESLGFNIEDNKNDNCFSNKNNDNLDKNKELKVIDSNNNNTIVKESKSKGNAISGLFSYFK